MHSLHPEIIHLPHWSYDWIEIKTPKTLLSIRSQVIIVPNCFSRNKYHRSTCTRSFGMSSFQPKIPLYTKECGLLSYTDLLFRGTFLSEGKHHTSHRAPHHRATRIMLKSSIKRPRGTLRIIYNKQLPSFFAQRLRLAEEIHIR
jgi:hypothetical protein